MQLDFKFYLFGIVVTMLVLGFFLLLLTTLFSKKQQKKSRETQNAKRIPAIVN